MTPRKRHLWNASGLRGGQELYDSEIRLLGIQYGIIIIDIIWGKKWWVCFVSSTVLGIKDIELKKQCRAFLKHIGLYESEMYKQKK